MRFFPVLSVIALGVVGCAPGAASPGVLAGEPWARTTEGKQQPEMTAVFVNLTNPSGEDIKLISAECADVAERTELHVMEKREGSMVMVETDSILIPAESHEHLAPGGPHIMLRGLKHALPVGGEEVRCRLVFDNKQEIEITAPVKEFTEEQETYHTHEDGEEEVGTQG